MAGFLESSMILYQRPAVAALALLLVAGAARAQPSAEPIVAAERAFAADGGTMGVDASFLKWSTEDSLMILAAPTRTREVMDANAAFDPGAPRLFWYPQWAGVAMSGELGFSTGPVEVGGVRRGHYFTVWRRQPDGGWKWIYDGGTGAASAGEPGPDAEPAYLPTASVDSASPELAMTEVRAAEAVLSATARTDQKAAHLAALAADGRLYVAPLPPAKGAADFEAALAGWPATFELGAPLGGGSSDAGDLVWTYGTAGWTRDAAQRTGHYVHVWQKRPEGWKLVFAQLLPAPPPAEPPAA
jgi:ketosteroid isomerase-like protein